MKYKITFFILFCTAFCNAQIVSIPDVNFKNALLSSLCVDADLNGSYESDADLNNDGEIQVSEALAVQRLKISGKNISNLTGIASFTNLKRILCNNNLLTNVDFSSNLNLQQIDCFSNSFVSLTINGLPSLSSLTVLPNTSLQNLTVTNNPSLTSLVIGQSSAVMTSLVNLNCSQNALTSLNLNYNFPNLTTINCSYNQLTYVAVLPGINVLDVSNNHITEFMVSNQHITSLNVSNNNLTGLSIYNSPNLNSLVYTGNPDLNSLSISNTNMSSLSVHDFPNLQYLGCDFDVYSSGTKLTALQVYNLPALTSFGASGNNIANLTLSNLPLLEMINVSDNPNINLSLSNLPLITGYEAGIGNSIAISNMPNLSTLSFGPGQSFKSITVDNNPALESLYLSQWEIEAFQLTNCPSLTSFDFTCNLQQTVPYTLNLDSLPSLASVTLNINDYCNLNLNNLPVLYDLGITGMSSFTIHDLPQLHTLQSGSVNNFTLTNLPNLYSIYIGSNLTSLNLASLPNLYTVNVSNNPITSISLVNLPLLHDIKFEYCYTGQANNSYAFINLPNLYELNLKNTSVANVTLNNLPSLHDFKLSNNTNMTALNFNNLPDLNYVEIVQCQNLSTVGFSNLGGLNKLFLYSTGIEGLTLSNLPNLYDVEVSNNNDIVNNGLVFSDLPNLEKLKLSFNQLTSFNFNSLPSLHELDISNNDLFSINLSNLTNLSILDISGNSIFLTSLDLSSNPLISKINYSNGWYNDQLKYINLRNGASNVTSINVGNSITKICVDDLAEKAQLQLLDSSLANTVFTTYCSFNPAGNFYTLEGNTILDANNNGCDANDVVFPMVNLAIENNGVSNVHFANNSGNYEIPLQAGSYTITPMFENPSYYTFSPASIDVEFPIENANSMIQNFCVVPNGNHNDLEINILPLTQARPGFDATYKLVYKNKGNQVQSGTIHFTFNDSVLDFTTASESVANQSENSIDWNFVNLLPFESRSINVVFNINSPIETPPVISGDVLNFTSEIEGLVDENVTDNIAVLNQSVVNSFDPNDKACLEGKTVSTASIGQFVHYMIRFENTGTASAVNIVVKDMIDLQKFDLSSLIPLSSSHSFYTRITESGQVEFIFENINLPHNAPNDKGYIAFKIKTKSTLVATDTFSNQVNIYFDYNNPIVTNNYITTIQQPLEIHENQWNSEILMYPNPVTDVLFFKTNENITKVEVFDLNGRILRSSVLTTNELTLSELQSGTYLLKVYTDNDIISSKIIKK